MLYKNSMRLIFSNFSLTWKLLIYILSATLISSVISYLCCLPIINVIKNSSLIQLATDAYTGFVEQMNLSVLLLNIENLCNEFLLLISANISRLLFYIIMLFFNILVLSSFLRGFYLTATCTSLYSFMSSGLKKGFALSFFDTFNQNMSYQLVYLITILPIKLLIYYITFISFKLLSVGGIISIIAPMLIVAIYTILNGIRLTIFAGWVPAIVVKDLPVFKALKESLLAINRRKMTTFSNAICVVLTIVFLNVFVGIFTFGVGFFISIPFSFFLVSVFNMTSYYTCKGMKFYVEPGYVIAPKKMEYTDNIGKMKYIL